MVTKGQKINDRYEVIRSIGEGGMANVYLGYDTILDRNVAIKILRGDLSEDEKFVRRFQREAISASSLNNPNISMITSCMIIFAISYIISSCQKCSNSSFSKTSNFTYLHYFITIIP